MQGRKVYQEKLFTNFQLSEYVPADNLYRKIDELIDFQFIYGRTSKYYGREGRKSVDPVVFMKLMLVGYLENINSDRRIIESSKLRMDILLFIGYDLGEQLPWHSTLSRTRQLYGQEVFTEVFRAVLRQCIDKGMVSGRRQAVDGFFVKANASLDGMVEREILDDAEQFVKELEGNVDESGLRPVKIPKRKGRRYPGLAPKKNAGNRTHYNPKDPDAKMSIKPGKAMALNYLGEVSVDTSSHVITHIQAFTAEKHDHQCLAEIIPQIVSTLGGDGLEVEEVLADKGFSSGQAIKSLEEHGITGYIPNRGRFMFQRSGFTYDPDSDSFTCPSGKKLTYKNTYNEGGYFNKHYTISSKDCSHCPLADQCAAYRNKKRGALIKETVDRPFYERMHHRMQTRKATRMMKIRQSTVEPVIGTLVNFLGLRKLNTIGLSQANKCMTIAAAAYNLKKLAKYTRNRPLSTPVLVKAIKERRTNTVQGLILPLLQSIVTGQFLSNWPFYPQAVKC